MEINYFSILKLHQRNRGSVGMDQLIHTKLYLACDYLSMLISRLIRVN